MSFFDDWLLTWIALNTAKIASGLQQKYKHTTCAACGHRFQDPNGQITHCPKCGRFFSERKNVVS
jgi:PHP family Zn ribbon phosphoesterase